MQPIETHCTMRTQPDKLLMSSEDHAHILDLLSESLNHVVANAVYDVSGRLLSTDYQLMIQANHNMYAKAKL